MPVIFTKDSASKITKATKRVNSEPYDRTRKQPKNVKYSETEYIGGFNVEIISTNMNSANIRIYDSSLGDKDTSPVAGYVYVQNTSHYLYASSGYTSIPAPIPDSPVYFGIKCEYTSGVGFEDPVHVGQGVLFYSLFGNSDGNTDNNQFILGSLTRTEIDATTNSFTWKQNNVGYPVIDDGVVL